MQANSFFLSETTYFALMYHWRNKRQTTSRKKKEIIFDNCDIFSKCGVFSSKSFLFRNLHLD